jgi:hypothetical protein
MLAYDASDVSQLDVTLAAQKLASETAQIAVLVEGSSSAMGAANASWTKVREWSALLDHEEELDERLEFELHDAQYKTLRVEVTTNSTVRLS